MKRNKKTKVDKCPKCGSRNFNQVTTYAFKGTRPANLCVRREIGRWKRMLQPYAKAYFKVVKPSKFKSWEYISWITAKHTEFRKLKGLGERQPYSDKEEQEFIEYINEK